MSAIPKKFAISPARVRALNRLFYPRYNWSRRRTKRSIRQLMESGFVAPGKVPKSSDLKAKPLLRLTQAGKVRLRVLQLSRIGSFSNLPSHLKLRYAAAFLVDFVHQQRVTAFDEEMREWVRRPIHTRRKDPYAFIPKILADEVQENLESLLRSAQRVIFIHGVKYRVPIDDFPGSVLGIIRDARSRDALIEYALDSWQSEHFRMGVFAKAGKLWPEARELMRQTGLRQRLEKTG